MHLFDAEEELRLFVKVCRCEMPPDTSEIYELVKKCQVHQHTHICYKNNNNGLTRVQVCIPKAEKR